jgi:hypothetical protein
MVRMKLLLLELNSLTSLIESAYVPNISQDMTTEALKEAFSKFGQVLGVEFIKSKVFLSDAV